tara:strand:+ start:1161 stop:2111 length:951 start_codon:yes stop_codon:yes gene_type:complete
MSFAALKKNSNSSFEKLTRELEKVASSQQSSSNDDRFWKPELDKSSNGYAVIRFLPAPDGEDLPWAKLFSHAFQGPGGWYIENSLTTINKSDPVGEMNRELWNSGRDSDKEIARKQKRKLSYYSNIYVVRDPLHPENEGKVFLFKFGKKIYDKIIGAMQPEFEDETPINPFDFWAGADFKLKIKKVAGYWNYDSSEFASVSTLGDFDDDQLEEIYAKTNSLVAFTEPSNFKTYEELQKRLNTVLNTKKQPRVDMETEENELQDMSEGRGFNSPDITMSAPSRPSTPEPVREEVKPRESTDDDDALSFFANLAEFDD